MIQPDIKTSAGVKHAEWSPYILQRRNVHEKMRAATSRRHRLLSRVVRSRVLANFPWIHTQNLAVESQHMWLHAKARYPGILEDHLSSRQ